MPRTSPVHYIAPSAISITPNANGSANDLAVYVARGAKIKVYSPRLGLGMVNGAYQEWTISGVNRRLAESLKPYTVYARLPKTNRNNGYLVFAPKVQYGNEWVDKYPYITTEGLADIEGIYIGDNNWWVRLGDVSLPENGARTLTLDTGILGTDEFNTNWALNPDALPLRMDIGCTINDEDAGPTPYVYWGKSLVLTVSLTEGWTGTEIERFDHWEIIRNSGDATTDTEWNNIDRSAGFGASGQITLSHACGSGDDFNGAVATTFIIKAMGIAGSSDNSDSSDSSSSSSSEEFVELISSSIVILAETVEKYEFAYSESIVSYNPQTRIYTPTGGVVLRVRATDQRGNVFYLTRGQITNANLTASYAPSGSSTWTELSFTGAATDIASATIPISAFYAQKSVNFRLTNADGDELSNGTVAFVRDGEDSKEREWIFLRSTEAITFGTQAHPYPASISQGEVNPPSSRAASGEDTNKNQDGWVPNTWWDEMQGTDEINRYEYGSFRDYDHANSRWGAFSEPKIWSHYGKNGDNAPYDELGYGRSKSRSSHSSSNMDISYGTGGWGSEAPSPTTTYPYIWERIQHYNAAGTLTGTSYVCLTGDDGKDAQYIYLKGTARDADSSITSVVNPVINVNGGSSLITQIGRGLNLVTINRQTLAVVESINYDTYGEAMDESGKTGITDLITKLNTLDDSVFVCLVSQDAIGWSDALITAMQGYGMGDLPYTDAARHPFLFIGYKGLGKGNGLTRMRNVGAYTDVVELSVYAANGALSSHDGENGKDGENGYAFRTNPTSVIITESRNRSTNAKTYDVSVANPKIVQVKANVAGIDKDVSLTSVTVPANTLTIASGYSGNTSFQITGIDSSFTGTSVQITVSGTCDGKEFTLPVNVYVNRLGTAVINVFDDTITEVATKMEYGYEHPDAQQVDTIQHMGQYIRSSEENISTIQGDVYDQQGNLAVATKSEVAQTAAGITSTVESMAGYGKNLLLGTENYDESNPLHHESSLVDGVIEYRPNGSGAKIYTAYDLIQGKEYVLQCKSNGTLAMNHGGSGEQGKYTVWLRYFGDEDVNHALCFSGSNLEDMEADDTLWWKFTPPISGTYYFRTNTYSDGTTPVSVDFWDIMLEIADEYSPRTWEAPKRDTTKNVVTQTASEYDVSIRNDLGETGININGNDRTIHLSAEHTTIDGDLSVPKVITQGTGTEGTGYKIEVDETSLKAYNDKGSVGLSIGWENGNPFIFITNGEAEGSADYKGIRLTYDGVIDMSANFTSDSFQTWHLLRLIPDQTVATDEMYSGLPISAYPARYLYSAAKNLSTGVYMNSDGHGSDRAVCDGKMFKFDNINLVLNSPYPYVDSGLYITPMASPATVNNVIRKELYSYENGARIVCRYIYMQVFGVETGNPAYWFCDKDGNNLVYKFDTNHIYNE